MEAESIIKEILEGQKDVIKAQLTEQLQKQLINSLSYRLQDAIGARVSEFVNNEMKDEMEAMLKDAKPKMIEEMKLGIIKVGAKLSETLYAKALENLDSGSYKSRDIIKKIFE